MLDLTSQVVDKWFDDVAETPRGPERIKAIIRMAYRVGFLDGTEHPEVDAGDLVNLEPPTDSARTLELARQVINLPPFRSDR